jgi:hypothetical protein
VDASYIGPPVDDQETLGRLPDDLRHTLADKNGFILNKGGIHVRGVCLTPEWHSIRAAWEGDLALHRLYPAVKDTDIPIAEDCFGDQYLLRDGFVIRLFGETGELESSTQAWSDFMVFLEQDPVDFLQLGYLEKFLQAGGTLHPGQQLSVYPPFVAKECVNPSLRPISTMELRAFLADFAGQIRNVEDGKKIEIVAQPKN